MKMKSYVQCGIVMVALAFSVTAHAGFLGYSVEATAFYPDLTTPTHTGGPVTEVVGAGIEFTDGEFIPFFGPSFDFADTTITITHAQTSHQAGTFNGYRFFDAFSAIDAIYGLTILSDSTGFFAGDPTRVSFDNDNIFVNFQSLNFSGQQNPTIVLSAQFQPAAVPEPATMLLLGVGLVGLAAVRRKFSS